MIYTLDVNYPDGHVEEIEETFDLLDDAKAYAENLLLQVGYTEQYHGNKGKKHQPYYFVKTRENDRTVIVFDSRNK